MTGPVNFNSENTNIYATSNQNYNNSGNINYNNVPTTHQGFQDYYHNLYTSHVPQSVNPSQLDQQHYPQPNQQSRSITPIDLTQEDEEPNRPLHQPNSKSTSIFQRTHVELEGRLEPQRETTTKSHADSLFYSKTTFIKVDEQTIETILSLKNDKKTPCPLKALLTTYINSKCFEKRIICIHKAKMINSKFKKTVIELKQEGVVKIGMDEKSYNQLSEEMEYGEWLKISRELEFSSTETLKLRSYTVLQRRSISIAIAETINAYIAIKRPSQKGKIFDVQHIFELALAEPLEYENSICKRTIYQVTDEQRQELRNLPIDIRKFITLKTTKDSKKNTFQVKTLTCLEMVLINAVSKRVIGKEIFNFNKILPSRIAPLPEDLRHFNQLMENQKRKPGEGLSKLLQFFGIFRTYIETKGQLNTIHIDHVEKINKYFNTDKSNPSLDVFHVDETIKKAIKEAEEEIEDRGIIAEAEAQGIINDLPLRISSAGKRARNELSTESIDHRPTKKQRTNPDQEVTNEESASYYQDNQSYLPHSHQHYQQYSQNYYPNQSNTQQENQNYQSNYYQYNQQPYQNNYQTNQLPNPLPSTPIYQEKAGQPTQQIDSAQLLGLHGHGRLRINIPPGKAIAAMRLTVEVTPLRFTPSQTPIPQTPTSQTPISYPTGELGSLEMPGNDDPYSDLRDV